MAGTRTGPGSRRAGFLAMGANLACKPRLALTANFFSRGDAPVSRPQRLIAWSYVTHLIEAGYDPAFVQIIWGPGPGCL